MISSVQVVIPSRGRPDRAREVLLAFRETATIPTTRAWLAVDHDDPCFWDYVAMVDELPARRFGLDADAPFLTALTAEETGDLVRATNTVSGRIARIDPHAIIGNWGDDHVPRTVGWDVIVRTALAEPGIAYGDDRLQGERLATAPFISAEIVRALGWYALPTARHLYIDNVWMDIGVAIGRLRYLPDVVIEHMHPAAGKAELDDGYVRANSEATTAADRAAYNDWRDRYMKLDVDAVRRAIA